MLPTYQILLTGLGHNDVHRFVTLLESFDVDFHRIQWNGRLLAAVRRTSFDVVIAGHPGLEMPVDVLGWDGAVGDLIFPLRDRAGFVQRALTAQARELKEWVIEQTRSTQAEVDQLREQVSTQQAQVEELSAQLQDLRALVTSQQKVLMYMGKDMELAQPAELELSLMPSRAILYRERDKKSPRDRREASAEASQAPYLNA